MDMVCCYRLGAKFCCKENAVKRQNPKTPKPQNPNSVIIEKLNEVKCIIQKNSNHRILSLADLLNMADLADLAEMTDLADFEDMTSDLAI